MKIKRRFTHKKNCAYDGIVFEERMCTANAGSTGQQPEIKIVVPDFWSQTASEILARQYCRRTGVPAVLMRVAEEGVPEWLQRSVADEEQLALMAEDQRFGPEQDARAVFDRMAGCWTYWGFSSCSVP